MVLVKLPIKYRKVFYNKIFNNDRVNVDFTNKYDNIPQVIKIIFLTAYNNLLRLSLY